MANATIIYACTQDGLFISNKPGTSEDWLPYRQALHGRTIMSAWARSGLPIRVLAAAGRFAEGLEEERQDELLLSENGGRTWETALAAPVTALCGSDEPQVVYAGLNNGGIAVSTMGGVTWGVLPAPDGGRAIQLIAVDAEERERFYLLTGADVGETLLLAGNPDRGEWHTLPVSGGITDLAQDPTSYDLYALTPEGVQMSADRGTTWGLLPGSPGGGSCVAVVPGRAGMPSALFVCTGEGLLLSADGGGTWQDVALPQSGGVTHLVRDPERRDRLYVATAAGFLYESGNRGQTWQAVNTAPLPPVNMLLVVRV